MPVSVVTGSDFPPALFALLPRPSQRRLRALVELRNESFDIVGGISERIMSDLRPEKVRAENELRSLEEAFDKGRVRRVERDGDVGEHDAGRLVQFSSNAVSQTRPPTVNVPDNGRMAEARQAVEDVTERLQREQERQKHHSDVTQTCGTLIRRSQVYLASLKRKTTLRPCDTIAPNIRKGEQIPAALARVREEIAALKREARTIGSGPGSVTDAKAKARMIVEELARSGTPDVRGLFTRSETIVLPRWNAGVSINSAYLSKIDGAALLIAMFKEEFIHWLDELIDAEGAAITGQMTAAQRTTRLAQIAERTLALDYQEAAIIDAAADQGLRLLPRADADIRAVLGLLPDSAEPPKGIDA